MSRKRKYQKPQEVFIEYPPERRGKRESGSPTAQPLTLLT